MPSKPDRAVEVHVCYSDNTDDQYPHWLLSLSVDSSGIASSSFQGSISPRDVDRVVEAAKRIQPQQCQMFVVAVVAELEKEGLLKEGRTAFLKDWVRMSQGSMDWRRFYAVAKSATVYGQRDYEGFYGTG